eukprot:1168733-Pyramimonas_sp.AAC.1
MEGGWSSKCGLAKDPTMCRCEYRNYEYHFRPRPLWGHELCEGRADVRGGAHNASENDRRVCEKLGT